MKYVSVTCWSNGIAATITPDRPPSRKNTMKPTMNSSGVRNIGVPVTMVMIQAKSWMPLGITMIRDAAAK